MVAFSHTRSSWTDRWRYGAVCFAWSNFLTLGPLAGPAMRFWLYRPAVEQLSDLHDGVIAVAIAFSSGLVAWTTAALVSEWTGIGLWWLVPLAFVLVSPCGSGTGHHPVAQRRGRPRELAQVFALAGIGWTDWLLACAVFVVCLRAAGSTASFSILAQTFFVGQVIGVVSLVPGGFGSSDAFWIARLPLAESSAAAVLIAYRVIYYVMPWAAASLLLLSWVTRRAPQADRDRAAHHRRSRRWRRHPHHDQQRVAGALRAAAAARAVRSAAARRSRSRRGGDGRSPAAGSRARPGARVPAAFRLTLVLLPGGGVRRHPEGPRLGRGGGPGRPVPRDLVAVGALRTSEPRRLARGAGLRDRRDRPRPVRDRRRRLAPRERHDVRSRAWTSATASRACDSCEPPARWHWRCRPARCTSLLRTPVRFQRPETARCDACCDLHTRIGAGTNPLMIATGDKSAFVDGDRGFCLYRTIGPYAGGLLRSDRAPAADRTAFLDAFFSFAGELDRRPVFYQISLDWIPVLHDRGYDFFKLGEEAHVRLDQRDARRSRRARCIGRSSAAASATASAFRVLRRLTSPRGSTSSRRSRSDWLQTKGLAERQFSIGFFDRDYLTRYPCAIVEENRGTASHPRVRQPARGAARHQELSVDLMRHRSDGPKVMDFLFVSLFLRGKEQGYARFNLGMAPLASVGEQRGAHARERLARVLFQRGEQWYNFQGLRAYKDKFDPEWVPRYMAYQDAWEWPVAIAYVSALIAGGWGTILTPPGEEHGTVHAGRCPALNRRAPDVSRLTRSETRAQQKICAPGCRADRAPAARYISHRIRTCSAV